MYKGRTLQVRGINREWILHVREMYRGQIAVGKMEITVMDITSHSLLSSSQEPLKCLLSYIDNVELKIWVMQITWKEFVKLFHTVPVLVEDFIFSLLILNSGRKTFPCGAKQIIETNFPKTKLS